MVQSGSAAALSQIGRMKSAMGEDYQRIFAENPFVLDALDHTPLLLGDKDMLSTAFNVPWTTATLWSAATGAAIHYQHPLGKALGGLFHYGPGHAAKYAAVNQFMDSVAGAGHRLKFGHSFDFVPEVYEQFGAEGVQGFFLHWLQDFTTVQGVPVFSNSWDLKNSLHIHGMSAKAATGLLTVSAANLVAGLMLAKSIHSLWTTMEREKRIRKLLKTAQSGIEHSDYSAAIESYKAALDLERSPTTMLALAQVYLLKTSTRPYAHRAFTDVVEMLGTDPSRTVPYHGAQISLRGVAGLQALATSDVIGDRYPQYWQERVESLVNATVHSFASTANILSQDGRLAIENPFASPPLFSAAINRCLAAQVACQYPFLDDRHRVVQSHLGAAISLIGRIAQSDEPLLRPAANNVREIWCRTLLPKEEAETLLATA